MVHSVLVVDDSRIVRKVLTSIINSDSTFEVAGIAGNGQEAIERVRVLRPDIITLDLDMPEMDGLTALPLILREHHVPVLIVSSLSKKGAEITLKALSLGAADFIAKPTRSFNNVDDIGADLLQRLKTLSYIKEKSPFQPLSFFDQPTRKKKKDTAPLNRDTTIVVIGISTGGPSALAHILPSISAGLNATYLIVQHMPRYFTKAFAERLDAISDLAVKEVEDGDVLQRGSVLVAQGGLHLTLEQNDSGVVARVDDGEKMCGHKPSVDKLFYSASKLRVPNRIVAVIMTGMGHDGASGIEAIKARGGTTVAQDEASCTVFGMPRVAIEKGVIDHVTGLSDIPALLENILPR